ncbi:hypothetical protein GEV33_012565 [Tenebrio molitor]|uniref:Fibronectin type III domain-containing protein n=1 Tax=Tenebrio molitor TaxID=7067 RepID=A0A8J6H8U3_TENMO|nr:hypothetical protein GEV33_012565 [Tenebrio molitor]
MDWTFPFYRRIDHTDPSAYSKEYLRFISSTTTTPCTGTRRKTVARQRKCDRIETATSKSGSKMIEKRRKPDPEKNLWQMAQLTMEKYQFDLGEKHDPNQLITVGTFLPPSGGLLAVPGTLRSNNAHNVANARDTKKSHQRKFNVRWIYNPVDMQIFFSPPDWHIKGGKSSRLSDSCQNCPGLKNGRKRVEVSARWEKFNAAREKPNGNSCFDGHPRTGVSSTKKSGNAKSIALDHTLGVPQVGEPSRRRKPDGRGRPRPSKRPSLDTTPDGHVHAVERNGPRFPLMNLDKGDVTLTSLDYLSIPRVRPCKSCTPFDREDATRVNGAFPKWDVGHGGISQNMEVEVREEASPGTRSGDSTALLVNNTPAYPVADGPVVIVRVEEVLLVVLVLMIWVAAIALFFNRWGKIRMLEPYQPKFHQQPHRPSCPLAPLSPPGIAPQVSNTLPRAQKPTTVRSSHA